MSTKINGGTGIDKVDPDIVSGLTDSITAAVTGNIVESGSNANGNYIKWADGTMICTGVSTTITSSNIWATGSYIFSNNVTLTFPVPFITFPVVTAGTRDWANYGGWGVAQTVSATAFGAAIFSGASNAIHYIAIGRWY